jgi:hypothetical protein
MDAFYGQAAHFPHTIQYTRIVVCQRARYFSVYCLLRVFSFLMQFHNSGKTSFCEKRLYRALLGVTPTLTEYASLGRAAKRSSSVLSSPIARMKVYCCFESQFCAARPLLIMELLISITLFPSSTSRLRFEIDDRRLSLSSLARRAPRVGSVAR